MGKKKGFKAWKEEILKAVRKGIPFATIKDSDYVHVASSKRNKTPPKKEQTKKITEPEEKEEIPPPKSSPKFTIYDFLLETYPERFKDCKTKRAARTKASDLAGKMVRQGYIFEQEKLNRTKRWFSKDDTKTKAAIDTFMLEHPERSNMPSLTSLIRTAMIKLGINPTKSIVNYFLLKNRDYFIKKKYIEPIQHIYYDVNEEKIDSLEKEIEERLQQ